MKKMQDQLEVLKEKIKSYGLNRENMRDLKKWILNDLMNEEAEEQLNASRYERNNNRKDYRNGYKQRSLLTTDVYGLIPVPSIIPYFKVCTIYVYKSVYSIYFPFKEFIYCFIKP